MSYNGSGVWSANSTGLPVVTGTTISSTMFNAFTADVATGLSTAVCKDGQQTCTQRVPFVDGISTFGVNLEGSTGAGQVGFTSNLTGAVARTVLSKERDIVSVKDFGTIGTGGDAAVVQAAIDALSNSGGTGSGGIVWCPADDYTLTGSTLTIYDEVELRGTATHRGRWYSTSGNKATTFINAGNGDTLIFNGGGYASLNSEVSHIIFTGSGTGSHIRLLDSVNEIRVHDCGFFGKEHMILAQTLAAGTVTDGFIEIDNNSANDQTSVTIQIDNNEGYSWRIHHNNLRAGAAECLKITSTFFAEQFDFYNNDIIGFTANNINVVHVEKASGNFFGNWLFCVVPVTFTNKNSYGMYFNGSTINAWGNTVACGNGIKCDALTSSHIGVNEVGVYSAADTGGGADNVMLRVESNCSANIFEPQTRPPSAPTVGIYQFQNNQNVISTQDFGPTITATPISNSNSPYTATAWDRYIDCDCTSGAITVNLPTITNTVHANGIDLTVLKVDSSGNAVTVSAGSNTINGSGTYSLATQYKYVRVVSINTNWRITGAN